MSEQNSVDYLLTVKFDEIGLSGLRKVESAIYRILNSIERMSGGNPDITNFTNKLQRSISTMRSWQIASVALQTALIPGAGWIAGISAIAAVGSAAFMTTDWAMSMGE